MSNDARVPFEVRWSKLSSVERSNRALLIGIYANASQEVVEPSKRTVLEITHKEGFMYELRNAPDKCDYLNGMYYVDDKGSVFKHNM